MAVHDPRRGHRSRRHDRAQRRAPRDDARWWSTAATGRCRSARTTTSPRPTRRCSSIEQSARGQRLDIAAGTSVRFEPGIDSHGRRWSRSAATASSPGCAARSPEHSMVEISRAHYRRLYGPDDRRSCSPRRHRSGHRGRARPVRRRRRGRVRRRQGDPRIDGPIGPHPRRGHARSRHHRRPHPRSLGRRQGRHRCARRTHRRHRQGRQPRHDDRRRSGAGDRPVDRDPLRQRPHPHRRRHRLPRAPHLPADRRRGAGVGHHHDHRWRHRAGRRHQGHHRHGRRVEPGPHARGDGHACPSTSCCSARATRCRTRACGSRCSAAPAASSCTRTGARRPPRSTPA